MATHDVPAIAPWGRWDRAALQAIFGGGVLFAGLTLVIGVLGIVTELISGERLLTLPVNEALPAGADRGTAVIVDGSLDSATVLVSQLSTAPSVLFTTGSIVIVVSNLLVMAAFLYLVWRLLRREPFIRSLTWTFVTAGAVLLIGSLVGQVLIQIANLMAMSELGSTADDPGIWATAVQLDANPLGLGFILMLVAAAFEYAQRLSNETRGLV
jgi:hypothetical protein